MGWPDWVVPSAIVLLLAGTTFYLKRKANPKAWNDVKRRGTATRAQVEVMLTNDRAPQIQPSGRVAHLASGTSDVEGGNGATIESLTGFYLKGDLRWYLLVTILVL